MQRDVYSISVVSQTTLTNETLDSFLSEHLASALRWQRLRLFLGEQLDPANNRLTVEAVSAMRSFSKPVLLVWGEKDTNFGPEIAKRLARDIPGTKGIVWLSSSAHLPMLEQPDVYSDIVTRFFSSGVAGARAQAPLTLARQ